MIKATKWEGFFAYSNGKDMHDNPYKPKSEKYYAWIDGFMQNEKLERQWDKFIHDTLGGKDE